MKIYVLVTTFCLLFFSHLANADVVVEMTSTSDNKPIGTVTIKDTDKGAEFIPNLHNLPPGLHGFHVHQNASCEDKGNAAGGHLDPDHTGKHLGPYNKHGHLGDLPVLMVDKDGNATTPVVAPRLKLQDLHNRSLMIHEGGDNYADVPKKLGGGGSRIACGVIK